MNPILDPAKAMMAPRDEALYLAVHLNLAIHVSAAPETTNAVRLHIAAGHVISEHGRAAMPRLINQNEH